MTKNKIKMQDSHLTNEMIEEMRQKIGIKLRIDHHIFNEEATRMAILKFADGIGDTNPLWRDKEYAIRTKYNSLIAPPSWVFSVFSGIQFGFRGLGGFHNSTEIEFYKPIYLNDKIVPECIFTGFDGPKTSSFAERLIISWYENKYFNQYNELVAKAKWSVIHIDRTKARKKAKNIKINLPHSWTDAELKEIEEKILSEKRSGENTPDWDGIEIGLEIEPLIKGPLGLTDEIAFIVGGGAPIPRLASCGAALHNYRRHPAWAFRDPLYHNLEPIYAVHYSKEAANAMGLPIPYDVGFQRHCWQIHLICNWMGDEGWLKKSYAEYRKFVYFSDVIKLTGKVVDKFVDEEGECCVKILTSAINQRNEEVMPGYSIVALPSKAKYFLPLSRRLRV